jgi:hypothetical protein
MMAHPSTPSNNSFFIAPARKRQNPPFACKTPVADVIDKSLHLFKLGPKHIRIAKIVVPLLWSGVDFEYDGKHGGLRNDD